MTWSEIDDILNYGSKEIKTSLTNGHEDMPELLTPNEVAEYLHIKKETVYTWKWRGKIQGTKVNGKLLFMKNYILEMAVQSDGSGHLCSYVGVRLPEV